MTALWLVAGLIALFYSTACREGLTAVDLGPQPPSARVTISGIVRGPGDAALPARTVEVVNVVTGETRTATTTGTGGFTINVPQGKYRLELPLHDGETIVKRPDVIDLDRGATGWPIEFLVSQMRAAHRPSYRLDNGLGSPIA